MNPLLSVIICTHNPRGDYFSRVLEALDRQTLPAGQWETIVVDNASREPVAERFPRAQARHIVERQLGLTHARLAGIREARGEILVFLDDDNVIDGDYLGVVTAIGGEWPQLGAWGGQTAPEWEEQPPDWTERYWNWIGVRTLTRDLWSNVAEDTHAHPFGAGLCVRRKVAETYASALQNDPVRASLGRTGTDLIGSEDADICFTAADLGLGTGVFRRLKLTHLIPRRRIESGYLLQLVESLTFSHALLLHARGIPPHRPSRAQRLLRTYQMLFISPRARRFDAAQARGRAAAIRAIARRSGLSRSFPPRLAEAA